MVRWRHTECAWGSRHVAPLALLLGGLLLVAVHGVPHEVERKASAAGSEDGEPALAERRSATAADTELAKQIEHALKLRGGGEHKVCLLLVSKQHSCILYTHACVYIHTYTCPDVLRLTLHHFLRGVTGGVLLGALRLRSLRMSCLYKSSAGQLACALASS
jgi:hypothetical protein